MAAPVAHRTFPYFLIGASSLLMGLFAGWTPIASRIDNYYYDWLLMLNKPEKGALDAYLLEIDDQTLIDYKGSRQLRRTMARALEVLAEAQPKAVAIDLILPDEDNAESDALLAAAMAKVPNLVLSSDIMRNADRWEEPYPPFAKAAKAIGHVHADLDQYDGLSRQVQLEKVAERKRRWAMALEAYRLSVGAEAIVESQRDLEVGDKRLPFPRRGDRGRPMLIRYRWEPLPRISLKTLIEKPAEASRLKGKVVFLGVTSLSQARDRWVTPYSTSMGMPGVEIHAHIYESLAQRDFLFAASNISIVLACIVLAIAPAVVFAYVGGWHAYAVAAIQILWAHSLPHVVFSNGIVFPILAPAACAWLSVIGCGSYQYFVVRKQLRVSEADRSRYQQAIHFVSHEMKSPLTAIQGSSELISRYNMTDEKRKQMALMINSESKRLAKMIQTFLDVERLEEGQMELKKEPFAAEDTVIVCAERARPLAERKKIALEVKELAGAEVLGDRELMEYAVYNLLSNAVKYSPSGTEVRVESRYDAGQLRIAVTDQGIGMDEKELKQIGQRFYRTKRAEQSGEAGTGIGLSIVGQIVEHHGGRLEIASTPGKGSCFTIVLPAKGQ
ncbi:MAG: CHASE2 domain-containing protein [Bryobacteraceae bacterium]